MRSTPITLTRWMVWISSQARKRIRNSGTTVKIQIATRVFAIASARNSATMVMHTMPTLSDFSRRHEAAQTPSDRCASLGRVPLNTALT